MSKENRSCQEFISNPVIPSNFEILSPPPLNCANCKRWDVDKSKCKEEIWVKPWSEHTTSIYEEEDIELPMTVGWCQY